MKQKICVLILVFLGFLNCHAANSAKSGKLKTDDLVAELTGKDISKFGEKQLYTEVISAHQRDNDFAFSRALSMLEKKFPQSRYLDSAIYMKGLRQFQVGNYSSAIRDFERIRKEFPRSNKVPAAMFAKAVAYEKINLAEEAKSVLLDIRKRYPGSPESFRAENQLKLMQ